MRYYYSGITSQGTAPCRQQRCQAAGRRTSVCRSAELEVEEIDRQRAQSGWNPYLGEEEGSSVGGADREAVMEPPKPFYQDADFTQVLEDQKMSERDLRSLQSMYPETAKMLLPYIMEECDKMEYEGSAMFDEYPDRTTIQRIEDTVFEQVRDQLADDGEALEEGIFEMQESNRHHRRRNWPQDLIRILLLDEMHHRRCRHNRCKGRF